MATPQTTVRGVQRVFGEMTPQERVKLYVLFQRFLEGIVRDNIAHVRQPTRLANTWFPQSERDAEYMRLQALYEGKMVFMDPTKGNAERIASNTYLGRYIAERARLLGFVPDETRLQAGEISVNFNDIANVDALRYTIQIVEQRYADDVANHKILDWNYGGDISEPISARTLIVVEERNCARCGAPAKSRCSGCKTAVYCSDECQRVDWDSGHKRVCH